jgi:hypothetical protein
VKHESEVLNVISEHFNLPLREIVSEARTRELYDARRCAYLVYRNLGWTMTRIGATFAKDHSTVVAAIQSASDADRELALRLAAMAAAPNNFELRRERHGDPSDERYVWYTYVLRNPRTAEEVDLPMSIADKITEALTYCDDD